MFEKTIQRRISDSVDFDRGWDDYVTGFGEADGNFWLGLENIHELTTSHDVSLYINIETFVGEPFTLKLQTFYVGNAASNYAWNISGFSQSADRIERPIIGGADIGMMFSTRDRDNDIHGSVNCASDLYRGGWWYRACTALNPNGNYEGDVTPSNTGIYVRNIDTTSNSARNTKAVKSIELIIRKRAE